MSSAETHLLDVNVLVALALRTHQHHEDAHRALAAMQRWATTPVTESSFLRLMLNPAVGARGHQVGEVISQLRMMRADPRWVFLPDTASIVEGAVDLQPLGGHRQVTDFHLVSIARTHGAVLATFDGGLPPALTPADRGAVVVLPVR